MKESEVFYYETFNNLQAKVDQIMDRSKYNKVDLGNIFKFMRK